MMSTIATCVYFWVLESETVHALVQPRDLLRAPAPTGWLRHPCEPLDIFLFSLRKKLDPAGVSISEVEQKPTPVRVQDPPRGSALASRSRWMP